MEENTRPSAKQRVLEAQGKEVPLDLFLYSCLEQERFLRATQGAGGVDIRWPLLKGGDDGAVSAEITDMPLSSLVIKLLVWYRDQFPDINGTRPLDHELLSVVVPPLVGLNQDLGRLYLAKTGEQLPEFEASVGNNKFWDDISVSLREYVPGYQRYLLRYVQWSHASDVKEEFEPGSRPPVGRYAPPPLRIGGDRPRRGDRPERGPSRGPERGPDRAPEHLPERESEHEPEHQAASRPDAGSDDNRPRFNNRGAPGGQQQGSDRPRAPRGGDRDRKRPGRGHDDKRHHDEGETVRLTEQAMVEVERAIASLKADPGLDEVTLKPSNSFYRRIQHQKAVDSGYTSFSVGEGPDRAVKVARKE